MSHETIFRPFQIPAEVRSEGERDLASIQLKSTQTEATAGSVESGPLHNEELGQGSLSASEDPQENLSEKDPGIVKGTSRAPLLSFSRDAAQGSGDIAAPMPILTQVRLNASQVAKKISAPRADPSASRSLGAVSLLHQRTTIARTGCETGEKGSEQNPVSKDMEMGKTALPEPSGLDVEALQAKERCQADDCRASQLCIEARSVDSDTEACYTSYMCQPVSAKSLRGNFGRPPLPAMTRRLAFSLGTPGNVTDRLTLLDGTKVPEVSPGTLTKKTIRASQGITTSLEGFPDDIYSDAHSFQDSEQELQPRALTDVEDDGSLRASANERRVATLSMSQERLSPHRPISFSQLEVTESLTGHSTDGGSVHDQGLHEQRSRIASPLTPRVGHIARAKFPDLGFGELASTLLSADRIYDEEEKGTTPLARRSNSVSSSDARSSCSNTSDGKSQSKRSLFHRGRLFRRRIKGTTVRKSENLQEVNEDNCSSQDLSLSQSEDHSLGQSQSRDTTDEPLTSSSAGSNTDDNEEDSHHQGAWTYAGRVLSDAANSEKSSKDISSAILLDQIVKQAVAGRCRLTDVLDAMYALSTKPEVHTTSVLYRYLSAPSRVEGCMSLLRKGTSPANSSLTKDGHYDDIRLAANPYHFVIVNAVVSGPSQLRKAILGSPRARAELFTFFEEDVPAPRYSNTEWELRTHDNARVLSSLLQENTAELTEHVSSRKNFLRSLLQNHISIGAVSEFLVQLCSANPLTETDAEDDVRYGPPNATGIVLLAKENVPETLVDIFESCTDDVSLGGLTAQRRREREEACLYCIEELSKRALVVPRYDKTNCSYSSRYIKQLNSALTQLSAYDVPAHLCKMLGFAFGALFGTPGDRGVAFVGTVQAITNLLDTVNNGSRSKLSSTRMTMQRQDTAKLEEVLLSCTDTLKRLVALDEGQRGTLQQLRLSIIDSFRSLFASKNASTLTKLVESGIPNVLFKLLTSMEWSSLMQTKIANCIDLAFTEEKSSQETCAVRRAWLQAMDYGEALWDELLPSRQAQRSSENDHYPEKGSHKRHRRYRGRGDARLPDRGYTGIYTHVALTLCKFADKDGGEDALRELMSNGGDKFAMFQHAREQMLDEIMRQMGEPFGGPLPQKTTASLLASPVSLASVALDDIHSV